MNFFDALKINNNLIDCSLGATPPEKVKKYSPIDFVNSIFTKDYIEDETVFNSQYSQFMVNRFVFGMFNGCYIELISNLNNKKITNRMHYDYLFYKLPKKNKIFAKYPWNKVDKDNIDSLEYIKALKWRYKYNTTGAEQALQVCSKEELDELFKEYSEYKKYCGIK
jgi:hypothetical protein